MFWSSSQERTCRRCRVLALYVPRLSYKLPSSLTWLLSSLSASLSNMVDDDVVLFLTPWLSLWLALFLHKSAAGPAGSKSKWMCIGDEGQESEWQDLHLFSLLYWDVKIPSHRWHCSRAMWDNRRPFSECWRLLHYVDQVILRDLNASILLQMASYFWRMLLTAVVPKLCSSCIYRDQVKG